MPATDDTESAMVRAVQDMVRKLDQHERHADDERKKLRSGVDATIASMREDFHKAISALQRDAAQHRDEHIVERKERAVDAIDRLNRQLTWNLWMGALTVMVVINLLLIGFVVVRVVGVLYGVSR